MQYDPPKRSYSLQDNSALKIDDACSFESWNPLSDYTTLTTETVFYSETTVPTLEYSEGCSSRCLLKCVPWRQKRHVPSKHWYQHIRVRGVIETILWISVYVWLYIPYGTWPLLIFLIYTQSAGLLGTGICQSQGRYLRTEQHKHKHPVWHAVA
jgi:hypothetical protein